MADKKGEEIRNKSEGKRSMYPQAILTVAILVVAAFTVGIAPVSAASVTRNLPDFVATSEEFTVTLTQTGFNYGVGIIKETLPDGFAYIIGSYTGGGVVKEGNVTYYETNRTLKARYAFVDDVGDELTSVTYRVTASSFGQTAEFEGVFATMENPTSTAIGGDPEVYVDAVPPYTDGHDPAKSATSVPVDTNITVHIRDDYYVNPNSINMKVDGSDVTSKLDKTIMGLDHWRVTYNPLVNFSEGYTVVVTVDATDGAGHAMPTDVYSFTTEAAGDTEPPIVTNPNADPSVIPEDTDNQPLWGESANLCVVVTDDSTIDSVTIDLSSIGGSAVQAMTHTGGDLWCYETNASEGSAIFSGGNYVPHSLAVTATDEHGNPNTSVSVELTVMKNGDIDKDGDVDFDDGLYLVRHTLNVPGYKEELPVPDSIADVDGDGDVDFDDGLYLVRHTLNVPGYKEGLR